MVRTTQHHGKEQNESVAGLFLQNGLGPRIALPRRMNGRVCVPDELRTGFLQQRITLIAPKPLPVHHGKHAV